jgi:hypothetical protein
MEKKIIAYAVGIVAVLGAAFLSQQIFFRGTAKTAAVRVNSQLQPYSTKAGQWAASLIVPKIDQNVKSGGEAMQNSLGNAQQNISNGISSAENKIQNYFSGIANSILHPGENNCATQPAQTSASAR